MQSFPLQLDKMFLRHFDCYIFLGIKLEPKLILFKIKIQKSKTTKRVVQICLHNLA